jgi:hypothetical protein
MTLERSPLSAGEPTWVSTEVRNVGPDDLVWLHDGCEIAVGVGGTIDGASWRPGRQQAGIGHEFKVWALETVGASLPVAVHFTPEPFVGRGGRLSCADIGIADKIPPGGAVTQRAQWDGAAAHGLGPPPSGRVELVGSFRSYWRASRGEPQDLASQTIDIRLTSWVLNGRDRSWLDPPEVVDAALADPRFDAWIRTRKMRDGADAVLKYFPAEDVWWVGLLTFADVDPQNLHVAHIDPRTGFVRQIVDRDWWLARDGWP